jgi:SOS response regulatory protein OraA/RecX
MEGGAPSTPVVSALRTAGAGKVTVDLDGAPWRKLPAEVVLKAGLTVGTVLDRQRVRRVRTELRRCEARAVAWRSLRYRDHSRKSLAERLDRANLDHAARVEVLETLERIGVIDDARTALARATTLVDRDAGDLLIRDDLERRGFDSEIVGRVLATLTHESERAAQVVARDGAAVGTYRRLASRGFTAETLEGLIADASGEALG